MRYFYPLGVLATTSALLLTPTMASAQQGDLDDGFGIQNNGSPEARAQARRQEALTPRTPATDSARTTQLSDRETPTPWFLQDSVRDELGFDEPDLGALYDNYDAVWQRHKERQAKLDAAKSDEEKALEEQAKLARMYRAEYQQDVDQFTQQNFNDQQRQRYQQLQRQYQGINAFDDPDYVEYFGFDSGQLGYISQLQDNYNRRMSELRSFTGSPAERRRRFNDLREQTAADLDRILTDEQRQALNEQQGSPFSFNDDSFFGSASDLDSRGRNPRYQNAPGSQPNRANPGSGIGRPGNAAPGSGIGTPQPNAPGAGSGNIGSGGPGGTAGDLDGSGAGGAGAGGGAAGGGASGGAGGGGASGGSGGSGN